MKKTINMGSPKSINVLIFVIIVILSDVKHSNANVKFDSTKAFEFVYNDLTVGMTTGLESDFENDMFESPMAWCSDNISYYVELNDNDDSKQKCSEMMTQGNFVSTFDSLSALHYAYYVMLDNDTERNRLLEDYYKYMITKFSPNIKNSPALGPYAYCIYTSNDSPFEQNNTDVSTQYSNEQYQSEDSGDLRNFNSLSITESNEEYEPANQYQYDYSSYQTDSSTVRDDQCHDPYAGNYNPSSNTYPDSQYNNIDDNQTYSEPYQSKGNINTNLEKQSIQSLPVLKNGSKFRDLKSLESLHIKGDVIFSNTCAFDSITTILMVSYSDSQNYSKIIDSIKSHYFKFVSNIVKRGITSSIYTKRADLIIRYLEPGYQVLEKSTLINCETTAGNVITKLMINFPSLKEKIECSNVCSEESKRNVPFISYQTNMVKKFSELQEFLNERSKLTTNQTCNNCGGFKKVKSTFSNMHLFIDIFHWEDNMISNEGSSDAGPPIETKLCDIPQVLFNETNYYELRGVISFHKGESNLSSAVGHYTSYARRSDGSWEHYDDLKKNPLSIESSRKVLCEYLIYTV